MTRSIHIDVKMKKVSRLEERNEDPEGMQFANKF